MESEIVAAPEPKLPFYVRLIVFGIYFLAFLGLERFFDYINFLALHRSLWKSAIVAAIFGLAMVTMGPPMNRFFSKWMKPLTRKMFR